MDRKIISLISYITLIGWIIAFVVGNDKKDSLISYHLKQGFGLFLSGIAVSIITSIVALISSSLASIVSSVLGILLLIMLIMGCINAFKEQEKPLPFVGKYFENQFSFIK